jgi:predicted alpha-1,6-mannanase (GH76 family)
MTGMCEDCLISLETKLKIRGEFNEYALNKMKANADAFFRDADKEVEVIKRELKNLGFVDNEFGDVEKWTFDDVDAYLQKIDNSYQEFKDKTLERFTTEK